jgi:hypothetical protein
MVDRCIKNEWHESYPCFPLISVQNMGIPLSREANNWSSVLQLCKTSTDSSIWCCKRCDNNYMQDPPPRNTGNLVATQIQERKHISPKKTKIPPSLANISNPRTRTYSSANAPQQRPIKRKEKKEKVACYPSLHETRHSSRRLFRFHANLHWPAQGRIVIPCAPMWGCIYPCFEGNCGFSLFFLVWDWVLGCVYPLRNKGDM